MIACVGGIPKYWDKEAGVVILNDALIPLFPLFSPP